MWLKMKEEEEKVDLARNIAAPCAAGASWCSAWIRMSCLLSRLSISIPDDRGHDKAPPLLCVLICTETLLFPVLICCINTGWHINEVSDFHCNRSCITTSFRNHHLKTNTVPSYSSLNFLKRLKWSALFITISSCYHLQLYYLLSLSSLEINIFIISHIEWWRKKAGTFKSGLFMKYPLNQSKIDRSKNWTSTKSRT
jgi:hypothetical protein